MAGVVSKIVLRSPHVIYGRLFTETVCWQEVVSKNVFKSRVPRYVKVMRIDSAGPIPSVRWRRVDLHVAGNSRCATAGNWLLLHNHSQLTGKWEEESLENINNGCVRASQLSAVCQRNQDTESVRHGAADLRFSSDFVEEVRSCHL